MKKSLFSLALGTFALGISEFLMMGIFREYRIGTRCQHHSGRTSHIGIRYRCMFRSAGPAVFRKTPLKKDNDGIGGDNLGRQSAGLLAPGYWMLFAARFISGLPHGAYFGVGAIVARRLAKPGHEVGAVSFMIGGMTVATLAGVPLGTFITNTLSWRFAFLIVAISGIVTLVAIRHLVPDVGRLKDQGFKGQFRFLKTLPPWLIFGGVIFGQTGFYCWYSYIDPQLTHVSGFSPDALSWLMILAGFGMFAGNFIIGAIGAKFKPSSLAATVELIGIPVLLLFYFSHITR